GGVGQKRQGGPDGGEADTGTARGGEPRWRQEAGAEQGERDRDAGHDRRFDIPRLGEERRSGDDDAGRRHERGRTHARARGGALEVFDDFRDDIFLTLTGRHPLVDRLVELVERRDGLTETPTVEVRDAPPCPPYPAGRSRTLRRPCHVSIFANGRHRLWEWPTGPRSPRSPPRAARSCSRPRPTRPCARRTARRASPNEPSRSGCAR